MPPGQGHGLRQSVVRCDCIKVIVALASNMGQAVGVEPGDGVDCRSVGVLCGMVKGDSTGTPRCDALDSDG